MKTFLVFPLTEASFATTSYSFEFFLSGLQIMQIWSINYYILRMSRYTNIVYIRRYLVLTYIQRFISTVCCFLAIFVARSVNCMSWVSKFNNFFLTCRETEARFIFEGLNIVLYGKFISDSAIPFCFFYLVCKLFKGLFQPLC